MSAKVFFDTNIFVYTFDHGSPEKREIATRLLDDGLSSGSGVISYQVVQEFLNVATRKFSRPMSAAEAFLYARTVLAPLCKVFPDLSLFDRALSIQESVSISFYDALIVAAAQRAGCAVLLSEDLQHGRSVDGLVIKNPFRAA